ncbi:MAG TPA: hypothetical protein VKP30_05015, partial [Polyangiaceae bacterium]|nr:hypothetical protein [Polyangiaceae bacterium]
MASKSLITLGAGLVLAMTLGCSSNKEEQSSCSADTQSDKNNCGQCGNVCSGDQTCQSGVCKDSTNGTGGSTSKNTKSTTGKGGSSNSTTSKAATKGGQGGSGGEDSTEQGGSGGDGEGGSNPSATKGGSTSKTTTKAAGGSTSKTTTKAAGGSSNVGGTSSKSSGGASTNGGSSAKTTVVDTGDRPPGYFKTSDWGVSSADWKGCVWTGIDTVASTTTTITPKDFTAVTQGGPYQVTGKVNKAYEAVALLGFNIGEAATGDANLCKYVAGKGTEDGPPSAPMASVTASTKGLAINWTAKTKPGQFRVQLQEPDCASNLAHCYCATITDATGPSFVAWSDFYAYCWNYPERVDTNNPAAVKYAGQDIDAVVFSVPGNGTADTAFDFTVSGFAPGDSTEDAPGEATGCGEQTGTIGATTASEDASMQRQVVTDKDCKKYVVFNNNWGQPSSTTQVLDYVGNSFTIKNSSAAASGQGVPGSFPSIYIGASGDLGGGTFSTWENSGLPKKISEISSVDTSFTWSGGSGGDYNAAYDVWFSRNQPTAGSYNDAISGFIMVWLYKPGSRQPIGSVKRQATIAGKEWDVWIGPRGNTSKGTDAEGGSGRPVVSYVAKSTLNSLSFNLKDFMTDAVKNASADKTSGGT